MSSRAMLPDTRITYRDGQVLASRDLRDDHHRDDRLRWLHARYIHDTWGIALGFEVEGLQGQQFLRVGPGYAIDSRGRDLVLAAPLSIPIPQLPVPATFILAVSYEPDAAYRGEAGFGCPGGIEPGSEHPKLCWLRPDQVRASGAVPLVTVGMAAGIWTNLDFRVRRKATKMLRPYLGWGSTEAGQTRWISLPLASQVVLLRVAIDTSAAGFQATPSYFATLHGEFGPPSPGPWPVTRPTAFSVSPCTFLSDAKPSGFSFTVMPDRFPAGVNVPPEEAQARQWTVSWIGVEPVEGYPPSLVPAPAFPWAAVLGSCAREVIDE